MKIGVYGGTFNPIHLGHMQAAKFAAEYLQLDKLLLIPSGIPPHKAVAENSATGDQRLDMTALAAAAMELPGRVEVLDLELRREGKSYTVDTLRHLRGQYPDDELYLFMGTDMFLTFQHWREPAEIAKLCTLCAFGRTEADTEEIFAVQREYLAQTYAARCVSVILPKIVDISSTRLRGELAAGKGAEYLAPGVYGYILRENLYGVEKDLTRLTVDELRCVAITMLKPGRVPHVLGTEETAAKLAVRWGADEDSARRAALLHDCTKRFSRELHQVICRQYKVELDELERKEDKLLHAPTGAALAGAMFGVSADVADAIRWHTTGKADMTLLEKIIYLADYIEPTRTFCDLTELRRLAFEDLDRALLLGFTMAVEDLGKKGMAVHPNSVYARDYLKGSLT